MLPQGVTFNVSLSSLRSLRRGVFIDRDGEVARTRTIVDDLRIKAQTLEQAVGTLSGGNQQKVVLGKMLLTRAQGAAARRADARHRRRRQARGV